MFNILIIEVVPTKKEVAVTTTHAKSSSWKMSNSKCCIFLSLACCKMIKNIALCMHEVYSAWHIYISAGVAITLVAGVSLIMCSVIFTIGFVCIKRWVIPQCIHIVCSTCLAPVTYFTQSVICVLMATDHEDRMYVENS